MPWLVAGVAAVGVAGSVIGAGNQTSAIKEGQGQANLAVQPWQTAGASAVTDIANLTGINGQAAATSAMGNFQSSPGYQYAVQQGLQGVDAGAASKGMLTSGQTIKAEQTLGTNLANQNFSSYVNTLSGLATSGLSAGQTQASTDTSAAGAKAKIAGAEASGITNSLTGALGSFSGTGGTGGTSSLTSMFNGAPIPQTSTYDGQMVDTSGWGNATGGAW
jgi:hypothetical protein